MKPATLFDPMLRSMRTIYSVWQKIPLPIGQQLWLLFMLVLTVSLLVVNLAELSRLTGLCLLLLMGLLTCFAWQWPAMQNSVMASVGLSVIIIQAGAGSQLAGFIVILMNVLLLTGVALYVLLELGKQIRSGYYIDALCWSALASGIILIVLRWSQTRDSTGMMLYADLPLTTFYDVLLLISFVLLLLFIIFTRSRTRIPGLSIALLPVSLVGLALGWYFITHDTTTAGLANPVLEHYLLLVHVPAMVLALALLLSGAGFAMLYLASGRLWLRDGQNRDVLETVQTNLEDYLYQQVALAVLLLGTGLLSGMLWANQVWGHYWLGEPKQVMSVACWLYYLAGIHLRLQKGMQGRAFAWWCTIGLVIIFLTFIGTNIWPQGLHDFGML